ncbi:MAG: hypothetical protein HOQ24_19570 [Mycobacteriaceae bacterium]|nr:hypothetical protein [Mycobacteriaceae bacterium]
MYADDPIQYSAGDIHGLADQLQTHHKSLVELGDYLAEKANQLQTAWRVDSAPSIDFKATYDRWHTDYEQAKNALAVMADNVREALLRAQATDRRAAGLFR